MDDFTASPGEAAAAESAGGAPEAAAQRAAATAATAETTADQLQTTAASAAPVSEQSVYRVSVMVMESDGANGIGVKEEEY